MPFGQIIIGPPGSGKSVYCKGMQEFLTGLGRKVCVVNLDPANDFLPYECAINIYELVSLDKVMEQVELGPNGGLVYAIEELGKNIDWLKQQLEQHKDSYFLFDCPGQVELYTHHGTFRTIVQQLQKWNYRMTAVHLVDSLVCTQPSNYISAVLLSLLTMLQLELPHVNVLSKIDILSNLNLDFNLEYYTDVQDLTRLVDFLNKDRFTSKYKKLNKTIGELIQDFSLVSFLTLNIQDKNSVYKLVKAIDKSNGYIYGGLTQGNESIMVVNEREQDFHYSRSIEIQDTYNINELDEEALNDQREKEQDEENNNNHTHKSAVGILGSVIERV